jgi:hypothetical protein
MRAAVEIDSPHQSQLSLRQGEVAERRREHVEFFIKFADLLIKRSKTAADRAAYEEIRSALSQL